jgi:hypothetical protein
MALASLVTLIVIMCKYSITLLYMFVKYFIVYRSREGEVELWMQDVVVQERLGGRVFNLARSYLYR